MYVGYSTDTEENGKVVNVPIEKKEYNDGLNIEASIHDQFEQIFKWRPLTKQGANKNSKRKVEYVKGRDYYKCPTLIVCDPISALEILQDAENFKKSFGINFLTVIDEYVATADCKISISNNHLLTTIINIINTKKLFSVVMSASTNEDEVNKSDIFSNCNKVFSQVSTTTRSFTQLFNNKKQPISPINILDDKSFSSVLKWDDTDYRFINPIAFTQMVNLVNTKYDINFQLTFNDVTNQSKLILAIKRFFSLIIDINDKDITNDLCKMKINYKFKDISKDSSLTLTSLDVQSKILNTLSDDKITHSKISELFKNEKQRISNELSELKAINASRSQSKDHDHKQSKLEIEEEISQLEHHLNSSSEHRIQTVTKLGSNQFTYAWYEKNVTLLSDDDLTVMLSGQIIDYGDERSIIQLETDPKSTSIIDDITSMFGRNDQGTKNVIIDDPLNILGRDTLKQGLARAGRSGRDPIVTGILTNDNLLNLFAPDATSSLEMIDKINKSSHIINRNCKKYLAKKNKN